MASLSLPSWQTVKRGMFSDTSLVVWVMVFQNLLRIVSSMILTRLLSEAAFAVMAVITSVLVTVALVSDIGIAAYLVRDERTAEKDFQNEVWTLRLIRGAILSAIIALIAKPVSHLLGHPDLAMVIAVAGLTQLLDGLGSIAPLVALRSRRIRKLTAIDVSSQVIGLLLTIALAWWLRSYWAIVISNILAMLLNITFSYAFYENSSQKWRFSRERSAELWRFSKFITGSTILTLVITQGDKLILARALPLDTLGLYVIAASLATAPVALVSAFTSRISYPLLAQVRREKPETLAHAFYHHRAIPSLLYAIAAGGLIGCGQSVIDILYDARYAGAGAFLQIMGISTFFAMGTSLANEVMIAIGQTRFTFLTNLMRISYMIVCAAAGWYLIGPVGIVWAVGTVELVAQMFGWFWLRRYGLLNMRKEAAILAVGMVGVGLGYTVEQIGRAALGIG